MRAGEVWSLTLENIKNDSRLILIRNNEELNWRIKTKEEDIVPISERLSNFLEFDLKNRNPEERYYLDSGYGKVFYSSPQQITRPIKKYHKSLAIS